MTYDEYSKKIILWTERLAEGLTTQRNFELATQALNDAYDRGQKVTGTVVPPASFSLSPNDNT